MKRIWQGLGIVLLVAVALAAWKREELGRLYAVVTLFDESRIVENFSNMDQAFLSQAMAPSNPPVAQRKGTEITLPDGAADWIEARHVTGLVILKDGEVVSEGYFQGTAATDKRISWSVAKSFLSSLVGVVLAEGSIESIDDPVTKYAPELAQSAYDGVSIRDVLTMSSGVRFDEDYLAFSSDINRMGRVLALGQSMDGFTRALTARDRPAGEEWQYVSIDTHVIGMVIRGATGRGIVDLMQEKILEPLGIDAYYMTDGLGEPFVLGGLNMTTRDYARFGQLFLQNGVWNGTSVVPANWVEASTHKQAKTAPDAVGYGFQWWVPQGALPGEFMARGVYGQYVYVNQPAGVVVAVNAADRNFREPGIADTNIAMFRKIAASF